MALIRIDRIVRGAGLATKKEMIALIAEGRVTVNGEPAESIRQRCDPDWDIRVDGVRAVMKRRRCLMLNKPAGCICATESDREPTVLSLLPSEYADFFPIGRLDIDSEGLLLLTNDGDLCHEIIMPQSGICKEYYIEVSGRFREDTAQRFREGIRVDEHLTCLPAGIEIAEDGHSAHVFVTEGKRHQVKRMAKAAGTHVTYLKRLAIGGLRLDPALRPGQFRELTEQEILSVFSNR